MANLQVKKLSFQSHGNILNAHLYLPGALQTGDTSAGVIVTGAWTTVKEQMPKVYAEHLANRGYAALTFDFRGWGESEGEARFLEDPIRKTEDIIEAAKFMAGREEIQPNKIAGLGICASSGYMVKAFIESPHIKTITLVAPWLHNSAIVNEVYGGQASVENLIKVGAAAREKFEATGELSTISAASTTDEQALMYQAPYYTEPERGLIPAYDNQFNLASWQSWLSFDAIALAKQLPGKITLVHSEAAAIPHGARQFAGIAGDKVNAVWLDGITQFDFYDQAEPVKLAMDAVVEHLQNQL